MGFIELAENRYSVRKFKNEKLPKEVIEKILHAGHIAPTGCNYQPQRIYVLESDNAIEALKNCTKCHFGAPTAMIVCYNVSESWIRPYDRALSAPVDGAIVTTHMMLEAHNIGVGSCWVMHFNPSAIKEEFNIPDGIEPLAILMLGYPDDSAEPHNFHNTFKDPEKIVFYEEFKKA